MKIYPFMLAIALLTACSPPNGGLHTYETLSTSDLWTRHILSTSPSELAMIEAELGSRNQTSDGANYLGRETASAYGKAIYSRKPATKSDKDCGDFSSPAVAQKFFLSGGGPASDIYGLDRDGDGFACEWGRQLTKIRSRGAATTKSTSYSAGAYRPSYGGACYTGPRGGRYTLSPSGKKNYGGC